MKLLYVVRRYGTVGGMERYVWETTRELSLQGHEVTVLCQRCHAPSPAGVVTHELGNIPARPGWLALLRFSWQVKNWLRQNPRPGFVIHSHERLDIHDITTFHCTPFATIRDKPIWKRLSLRVAMHLYMERRELATAKIIVPNSNIIRDQLAHYYPAFKHKLAKPITPGVVAAPLQIQAKPNVPANGGVIAFIGHEWKRKGLPFAVKIVAELRRSRPELVLWVIGPEPESIHHLFTDWNGGYRLLGWQNDNRYLTKIDVLLHPAHSEAYGMVISEAMAAQVPVVVSNACGAAQDVHEKSGSVVSQQASLNEWVQALQVQLLRTSSSTSFNRSWREIADEYGCIYRQYWRENPVQQSERQPFAHASTARGTHARHNF